MSFEIRVRPTEYSLSEDAGISMGKPKEPAKKKRTKKVADVEIVTPEDELPMVQSNVPYRETYAETDNILRGAIGQLSLAAAEIGEDLADIRASKTLRKKYDYIAALQSSRATIISTTVSAAREMNNSIKNSHELDLKRAKEMKLDMAQQDDVKSIQDMYNAFVSMPVSQNMIDGRYVNPLGPTSGMLTLKNGIPNMIGYGPTGIDPEAGYQNYINNMTPEQMTMMIEENPHINEVIAYDPNTGAATFEIYNSENGQFLQGVPKKNAEMFMPDMQFDFANMQAHSQNLNATYDVIYVDSTGAGAPIPPSDNNKMDNF